MNNLPFLAKKNQVAYWMGAKDNQIGTVFLVKILYKFLAAFFILNKSQNKLRGIIASFETRMNTWSSGKAIVNCEDCFMRSTAVDVFSGFFVLK